MVDAIEKDQADVLKNILKRGVNANSPLVSIL